MKKLFTVLLPCLTLSITANVATAKTIPTTSIATTSTKTANYICQQGKHVKVTYGFNRLGIPTYAKARINGRTRIMPYNQTQSEVDLARFGTENSYSLAGDRLTIQDYRKFNMSINSPRSEILFKDCNAY